MLGETMRYRSLLPLLALPAFALPWACAASKSNDFVTTSTGDTASGSGGAGAGTGSGGAAGGATATGTGGDLFETDGGMQDASTDGPLSADAACAAAVSEAQVDKLPVDIIWVVDVSASMEPAVTEIRKGLNAFASLIAAKNLDYKVIMLALRDKAVKIDYNGGTRYPVCIPPPLAGDDNCGNGPRFFHSSIDIKSTQPIEQFLGTLGQTEGYMLGQERGGEPWKQELRPEATKTIVVVTDDNARQTSANQPDFETFSGGKNPFNTLMLPPGILDPSWGGLFKDYIFSAIYGWGSATDPAVTCKYPDMTVPPSSGPTYTKLVQKTGGVRAKICDGSAAWAPFFDAVAQAVSETAKLSCELTIPKPPMGEIDPTLVNVALVSGDVHTYVPKVADASACGTGGGWYYDNPTAPTKVLLCQSSCDDAQAMVGPDKLGKIEVLFGCETILK